MRVGNREIRFSNPDKVFFPALGLRKGDLLRYYLDVTPCLLHHIRRRPMQMKRYPHGVEGEFFYQKRVPVPHPDWLDTVHIRFPSGRTADFPVCNDAASVAWIVNLGCIDLHTWHSRVSDIERPDYLLIDLDPSEGNPWAHVQRIALVTKEVMDELGLASLRSGHKVTSSACTGCRCASGVLFAFCVPLKTCILTRVVYLDVRMVTLTVQPRVGEPNRLELRSPRLVLAAYTGRDQEAVERHVQELAEAGVPPPETVPMFYPLPAWLLQVEPERVEVTSARTSGEAEPVLVKLPSGELYLGVGSDHTDRELERASVALAKHVCPKVVSSTVWLFDEVAEHWDALRLSAEVPPGVEYQDAQLAEICPPLDLIAAAERLSPDNRAPLVLFLGTVPLKTPSFSFDSSFVVRIDDPVDGRSLSFRYHVDVIAPGSSTEEAA